ncbi:unnamed protein product [Clonostachys rhizophaga]|uniref:Phosphatidylinositol N-acetylglucosaminyltransferase GPI2 subunit n=1 Tax=Clonostachys rhizophaga TaxID=160324 RepID=A0A9N9YGC7_9HYPO|nr:unnamed protein product [Clonostachys rhizophaga]
MLSPTDDDESETPFPTLDHQPTFSSLLSPDDAFVPPLSRGYGGDSAAESTHSRLRRVNDRGGSRRRKRAWKKLMWVKQSYPDNYTDQATFLENLQRNPRLKPYDFWPLVADSTVILQHVCSVIIFVVCFACIHRERVSPVSVVSWSSAGTFVGWLMWERWVTEEDQVEELNTSVSTLVGRSGSLSRRRTRAASIRRPTPLRTEASLSVAAPSAPPSKPPSREGSATGSATNLITGSKPPQLSLRSSTTTPSLVSRPSHESLKTETPPFIIKDVNRTHERLGTIKSAILIYCTLLGLSPILKSLTQSTSLDSIWAMSFWLLFVNIFSFDYSGGVSTKFPASLSTNAALMASTVLASRLPDTRQVFSLTLFSIEVFGLFPVFRRHVKHRSFQHHICLTVVLVLGAGLGVGLVSGKLPKDQPWPWKRGIIGMIVSIIIATLATGGCSWWLIGLQKYKNEIRGPWDPARPIIMSRQQWDDRV